MDGTELAKEISDSINSGINPNDLVDVISNDHRYLQGEVFTQIIKPLIVEYARKADAGEYDARNKQACIDCRAIADSMNWSY